MYRCKTCKSEHVQGAYWVDHNNFKIDGMVDAVDESWCEDCEEFCEIYDDEENDN